MGSNYHSRRKFIGYTMSAGVAIPLRKFSDFFDDSEFGMNAKPEIMVFSKQLEWIKDRNELCELVSKIGFDGFELTVRPGGYVLPEKVEEDLPRMAEAAHKAGIKITMIATRITDPGDPIAEKTLKTANELGIELYRMGGLQYDKTKSIEKNLAEFKAIFKALSLEFSNK